MLTKTEKKNNWTTKYKTGWWQLTYFLNFTPKFGEDSHFDEHIFQRGWFNHQLEKINSVIFGISNSADLSVFCWELEILQIPIQLGSTREILPTWSLSAHPCFFSRDPRGEDGLPYAFFNGHIKHQGGYPPWSSHRPWKWGPWKKEIPIGNHHLHGRAV